MFINFHAHPLLMFFVINIFAIHRFFFPLVYVEFDAMIYQQIMIIPIDTNCLHLLLNYFKLL